MISEAEADKIDQWLRKFQKEHGDEMVVNDDIINDLACALCDDIPLGYEASHRLANWLFCHLNVPKIDAVIDDHIHLHEIQKRLEDVELELKKAKLDYAIETRYMEIKKLLSD